MPSRNNRRRRRNNGDQSTDQTNRPVQRQRQHLTSQQMQPPVSSNAHSASNRISSANQSNRNVVETEVTAQREIPGFYFDPDKKRYFKIQNNHQAPTGAYSTTSVSERNAAADQRTKHKQRQARDARRFQRSKLFGQSLAAILWHREVSSPRNLAVQTAASRWLLSRISGSQDPASFRAPKSFTSRQPCSMSFERPSNTPASEDRKAPRQLRKPKVLLDSDLFLFGRNSSNIYHVTFKYVAAQKALIFTLYGPSGADFAQDTSTWVAALDRNKPFVYHDIRQEDAPSGQVCGFGTSIVALKDCFTESNLACLITPRIAFSTEDSSFVVFTPELGIMNTPFRFQITRSPEHNVNWSPRNVRLLSSRHNDLAGPIVSCKFQIFTVGRMISEQELRRPVEYWCAAIRPTASCGRQVPACASTVFEASNQGYQSLSFDAQGQGVTSVEHSIKTALPSLASNILSLEFENHMSWLIGCRDGWIIRTNYNVREELQPPKRIIKHPGSVTNIVVLKRRPFVIVNGIPNCLYLYHLPSKDEEANWHKPPITCYNHHNSRYPSLDMGFDVCESLDLIAASQDNGSIRLFHITTGELLQILATDEVDPKPFRTIQIVEENYGFCRVLAARDSKIYDFAVDYD